MEDEKKLMIYILTYLTFLKSLINVSAGIFILDTVLYSLIPPFFGKPCTNIIRTDTHYTSDEWMTTR